jgi:hypothetical protein
VVSTSPSPHTENPVLSASNFRTDHLVFETRDFSAIRRRPLPGALAHMNQWPAHMNQPRVA